MKISPVIFQSNDKMPFKLQTFSKSVAVENEYDSFKKSPESRKLHRGAVIRNGEIYNRNTTRFFREDINWSEFRKYLNQRFSDSDRVSTRIYGCSIGKEPYSLVVALREELGKNADKFFPIIAKDIDAESIAKANEIKNLDTVEFYFPDFMDGYLDMGGSVDNLRQYINRKGVSETITLKKDIKNCAKFSRANILEDLNSIDSKRPSIIMCRNLWPYIDESEYDRYTQKLFDKLKKGSVVVLGCYDLAESVDDIRETSIADSLLKSGFSKSNLCRGYEKIPALIYEKN